MIEPIFSWIRTLNDPLRNAAHASRWIAQLPSGDPSGIQKQALELVKSTGRLPF